MQLGISVFVSGGWFEQRVWGYDGSSVRVDLKYINSSILTCIGAHYIMLEQYTGVDGYSIRYLDSGTSGRPILLLHGLGGYADKWKAVMADLSDRYQVIAPDMLGSGQSEKPTIDYTPAYLVSFLKKFIDAVGMDRPNVGGSSLGGQIAVEFAVKYPEYVSNLILMSPAGIMKHSTPALDAYVMAALYPRAANVALALESMEASGRAPKSWMIEKFMANMMRPNAKMAFMSTLLCFKNSKNVADSLGRISSPTLLIWGHNDPIIPISYAGQFKALIPDCTFVGIKNCGHTPYVQYPDHVASIIRNFLAKHPGIMSRQRMANH